MWKHLLVVDVGVDVVVGVKKKKSLRSSFIAA